MLNTGLWPDGANVVASSKGYWSGKDFVQGWGGAKKYRPCTDDYLVGIKEAEKLALEPCWRIYILGDDDSR